MAQPYPAALIIASLESVSSNNNVLHRLVRPLADGSGVQSTDRLVNVVPHRRTYCFERKEQVESFMDEILRRPLVIQPVLHFGRGIGHTCGACYNDEPWVVMINQTHPKILGRLQMGMEIARSAVAKGQSVEIKFRFGKLIERVYCEHLRQKELGEIQSKTGLSGFISRALVSCRYAEWEYGDLTLRSHGLSAKLKASMSLIKELNNLDMEWDFEDIGMHDMEWSQLQPGIEFPSPHLASVSAEEIRAVLPGWTVNEVTPLEALGESAPAHSYSYAQANRLYASFKKARGQRPRQPSPNENKDAEDRYELPANWSSQGAEALPNYYYTQGADSQNDEAYRDNGVREKLHSQKSALEWQSHREDVSPYDHIDVDHSDSDYYLSDSRRREQSNMSSEQGLLYADKYGHLIPQVRIQQPDSGGNPLYTLKKQDSNRSTRSTNADSGYCASNEGGYQGSRGGSYDLNDTDYSQGYNSQTSPNPYKNLHRPGSHDYLGSSPPELKSVALTQSQSYRDDSLGGVANPAFSMVDTNGMDINGHYTKRATKAYQMPDIRNGGQVFDENKSRIHTSNSPHDESLSSINQVSETFI